MRTIDDQKKTIVWSNYIHCRILNVGNASGRTLVRSNRSKGRLSHYTHIALASSASLMPEQESRCVDLCGPCVW